MAELRHVANGAEINKRVMRAVSELLTEPNLRQVSVLSVARHAGIARSVLYASHPDLVEEIKKRIIAAGPRAKRTEPNDSLATKLDRLRAENAQLKRERDSLASNSYSLLDRALTAERLLEDLQKRYLREKARRN